MGVAESVNIHASDGRSLDVLVSGPPDGTVMVFHSEWLREHLPQARLRLLENEGHVSIVGHMPEIINTLLANSR